MQDVAGVRPSKWCAGCHDPELLFSGMFDAPIKQIVDRPEAQAGLSLLMCHSIVQVKSTMGQGDYVLEYPKLHELAASESPIIRSVHDFIQAGVSKTGPYARAAGNYTRYGDVLEFLRASDDRFAVFGSGEGVRLEFDPRQLPRLSSGWVRDYFFFADGFEKDLDFYAAHAFTIEPLPYHTLFPYPYQGPADTDHLHHELEYNTRTQVVCRPACATSIRVPDNHYFQLKEE
jgi:hypothetical protein